MTDDIITISAGAPPTDLTPGVYEVTLTDISEPRTIYPQTGRTRARRSSSATGRSPSRTAPRSRARRRTHRARSRRPTPG